MKYDIWTFLENLARNLEFHCSLTRITDALHAGLCSFMVISRWILPKMRHVPQESCRENQNTTLYALHFSRKSCFYVIHSLFMLGNWGWKHALRIYNTNSFSTATVGKRRLYNVFLLVLQFSPVSIIPPLLRTHSSIYYQRCIMFLSHYFSFPQSVSFHHCSVLIHPSTTNAV